MKLDEQLRKEAAALGIDLRPISGGEKAFDDSFQEDAFQSNPPNVFTETGKGALGFAVSGFISDRVVNLTGKATMGMVGSGSRYDPTINPLAVLLSRGGRWGMPLMPVNRR